MSIYHAPTPRSKLNVSDEVFTTVREYCYECGGECDEHYLCRWFVRKAKALQAESDDVEKIFERAM